MVPGARGARFLGPLNLLLSTLNPDLHPAQACTPAQATRPSQYPPPLRSHRKKRMNQIKKMAQRGLLDPEKEDPFSLFVVSRSSPVPA